MVRTVLMPFKVKVRLSDMGEPKKQEARSGLYPLSFMPLSFVVPR